MYEQYVASKCKIALYWLAILGKLFWSDASCLKLKASKFLKDEMFDRFMQDERSRRLNCTFILDQNFQRCNIISICKFLKLNSFVPRAGLSVHMRCILGIWFGFLLFSHSASSSHCQCFQRLRLFYTSLRFNVCTCCLLIIYSINNMGFPKFKNRSINRCEQIL